MRVKKRGFGWLPDLPDKRDHVFKISPRKISRFPSSIDLREYCSPIEDQGDLGSCTAHALVSALEFLEVKNGEPVVDYSRLFLYYNERVYIHTENEDSGAITRDGIKSLNRRGICSEESWPYNVGAFMEKPPKACYTEAKKHKTISYQRLNTLDQMKACLAIKFPFIFGFTVYDSFLTSQVASTGDVPMPDFNEESIQGGHAVLAVGYNDKEKRFLCRNSWGTNWGDKGYFTMPYKYVSDRNLSDDFWTIRF